MAFIKKKTKYNIGDVVRTTKIHEITDGYFEIGTVVTIIGYSERGYDIRDDEGNTMYEVGWET